MCLGLCFHRTHRVPRHPFIMIIPLVVLTCKYEMFQECKNILLKVSATFIEPPFVPGTEVAEMKDIVADPDVMRQS